MPEFVIALAAIAQGTATTLQIVSVISTLAFTAYNITQAQRAKRAARDAALAALTDRTTTIRSSDEPQPIVYGEARLGGVLAYACNHGSRREKLTMVLALAGHECQAIDGIYVNDDYLSFADHIDADGWVKLGTKWYDDIISSRVQTFTGPAPGGTVVVDYPAIAIDSVAYRDDYTADPTATQVVLTEGVGWTVASDKQTITILDPRAEGAPLVVTYRNRSGGPTIRVKRFLGIAAGERDTDLETASEGEWTAAHVGKNICRLHITVVWNERIYGAIGLPSFSGRVKGKKVYDWITGETTWSNNAARCAADYLMADVGFGVPQSQIATADMQAAQLACDEDVNISITTTQKRYTVDGSLSTDADRRQNLQALLTAMAGTAVWSGGKWIVRAGVFQNPTFTLGDDDLANGEVVLTPSVARRDLFNSVKGRFVDAWLGTFQSTSFPPYVSSTYIAQDGGVQIDADIDLPLVGDPSRAQRIAKLMLFRHRAGLTFRATYKFIAYAVVPGDTVYLRHAMYGWDTMNAGAGKLFTVTKREFSADGKVVLSFKEEAFEHYAWNFSEATGRDYAPNISLPDPTYVEPLSGFTVSTSAGTYSRLSDGTIVPYALVSWDPITSADVINGGTVRLWWKRADEAEWRSVKAPPDATSVRLFPVSAAEVINVRAYVESVLGVQSVQSFATHVVYENLISAVIAGMTSANYLTNPTFASGVTGWRIVKDAALTDPVEFAAVREGNPARIPGLPTNVIIGQGGAQAAACWAESALFPLEPGTYVAYASILPVRCRGAVQVVYYNAAGAVVGSSGYTEVLAQTDLPADPTAYKIAEARFTIEAGSSAVAGRLQIRKAGTNPGSTSSGLYAFKPFFGPIETIGSALPEWTAGAVQTVGTDQLEPGAATAVVEVKAASSGLYTDKVTGLTYAWYGKIDIANPAATPLQCIVSAVEDVQITFTGSGVYKLGLALVDDPTSVPIDPVFYPTVVSGGRGGGTLTVQRTFEARAQTVETYYLIGVIGAGSGSLGAPSDLSVGFPRLRAELIKR